MSRTLAVAASNVLRSHGCLDLSRFDQPEWSQRRLDTHQLLQLAPCVQVLDLDEDSYTMPGLPAFLAAATSLETVRLSCDSMLFAAQAGRVLPHCAAPCVVSVTGTHAPGKFPPRMRKLSVNFTDGGENLPGSWDADAPTALRFQLADQKHLKKLDLSFGFSDILLDCSVVSLPELLVDLSFNLTEEASTLDLSWLRHQPCRLSVCIKVSTASLDHHVMVVSILEQLPVECLRLEWTVAMPLELQLLWQRVSVKHAFILEANSAQACSSASEALQALPWAPRIVICSNVNGHIVGQPLFVSGAALVSQAAKFMFLMGYAHPLHVLGGCSALPNARGPWQVEVSTEGRVHGLHGARVDGDLHSLQNDAAVSAGWTVGDSGRAQSGA